MSVESDKIFSPSFIEQSKETCPPSSLRSNFFLAHSALPRVRQCPITLGQDTKNSRTWWWLIAPTSPATAMSRRKTPTAMTPPMIWMLDTRPRPLPQAATPMSNKPTSYGKQSRIHIRTLACSTAQGLTGHPGLEGEEVLRESITSLGTPTMGGQNGWDEVWVEGCRIVIYEHKNRTFNFIHHFYFGRN